MTLHVDLITLSMHVDLLALAKHSKPVDLIALFKTWTIYLADYVEIAAAGIIGVAAIESTIRAAWLFIQRQLPPEAKEDLRLRLARWLAVALEFELAADILRTAIEPTWNGLGLLAAVAAIRTGLNYFLEREIARAAKRTAGSPTAGNYTQEMQRNKEASRHTRRIEPNPNAGPNQGPNTTASPPPRYNDTTVPGPPTETTTDGRETTGHAPRQPAHR